MRRLAAIVLALTLLLTSAAQCDLPTTKGRDFWVGYLWNNGEAGTTELTITAISDTAATMTVENPYTGWSTTVNLTATAFSNMAHATIIIPVAQGQHTQGSTVGNFGLHVTSNADIWLTAMNNRLAAGDAASILPTRQLGTRYIVQDYPNSEQSESANLGGCEVASLATEDSTVLSMTLPCNTQPATVASGSTLNVTLQQGQTYLLVTPTPNEFSGMEVTSNGKPFAMFQGNKITAVHNGNCTSGDHIYEQAVPVEALGTDYVVTATYGRTWGDIVRITAADDTCIVTADGVPIDTLAPFASCDYHLPGNTTRHIHTSTPAGATLVMASSTWNAQPGDVSSVTVGTGAAPKPCVEVNRQELDFDNPVLTYHDCSEGRHHTIWLFADGTQYTGERLSRQFHHPLPNSVTVTMTTCNQYNCCADTTILLPMKIRSVWFPNVFTPDADNNRFQCYTSFDVDKFSLVIYNRWGLEIWSTTDVNEPWDGRRADGTPCVQGAYVYRYWITSADGRFDGGTGTVTLLH